MYYEDDPADWWKGSNESDTTHKPKPRTLTEIEAKIAHYEKRSEYHWEVWNEYGDKRSLYWYKQTNIKIRKLKSEGGK